ELSGIKVAVSAGGTVYGGKTFKQSSAIVDLNSSVVRFSRLIAPAKFTLEVGSFGGVATKQLAYSVVAASTGSINTATGAGQVAVYDNSAGTMTATNNGSLKNLSVQGFDSFNKVTINQLGIDGVRTLQVGDRILLMHQGQTDLNPATTTYQGNYQNGVYEIVSLGGANEKWVLKRVDFADSANEMKYLRIAVEQGVINGGARYIQTNHLLGSISAGQIIGFSDEISSVYGNYDVNGTLVSPWFNFSAVGQAVADLPLSVIVVPDTGGNTVITKDLGSLTDLEKKNLGLLGSGITNSDLYKSMPNLSSLKILISNDVETTVDAFTGSGLEKYFNTSLVAANFNPLPDLFHTVPPSDVLSILRDWSFVGDALDLALFDLQFSLDQALGAEFPLLGTNLPEYASFIEDFRDDLTTRVRNSLRLDPLKPINSIRNALFDALGPNGVGYLTSISNIGINVVGQTWNIDDLNNANYYGTTPEGLKFEKVSGSAVEFSFTLNKALDTLANAVLIDQINLGDSSVGFTISNQTSSVLASGVVADTTGGVSLRRSFQLNLGFGVDIRDGFYIFNSAQSSGSSNPTADFMNVGFQAELDGDIHKSGIQDFIQNGYVSQLNQLSVRVADGRADYATDGYHSGFFGNFAFNLNTGTGTNRVGNTDRGISTTQLGSEDVLGPGAGALMRYDLNADADIHLQLETQPGGIIPSYQTDFFFSKRFGTGSSLLTFDANLAGLGDVTLGNKILNGTATTEEYQKASPAWRVNRTDLTSDGLADGVTFIAFQNITIDIKDYLGGTLFSALQFYAKTTDKLKPVVDFLTTAIPGTEWMADPFVPADFLGDKFGMFLTVYQTLDRLLGDIPKLVSQQTRTNPRVSLGGSAGSAAPEEDNEGQDFDLPGFGEASQKKAFDKYKTDRETRSQKYLQQKAAPVQSTANSTADNRSRVKKITDAINNSANTPNKFSQKFDQFRDADFKTTEATTKSGKIKNAFKESLRDALKETDNRGGKKSLGANLQGGGIQFDALTSTTALNFFMGNTADLIRVELPAITVTFSYTRFFPLPAFPPLGMTLGFELSASIHLSFGWDTNGFYWTNRDASSSSLEDSTRIPAFGFSAKFSVGVALNLGLIEVGVQAYLEVGIEFYWNMPTGTEKIYQREITWLWQHNISLFDVRIYGKVGIVIYIDLTIPIPLVGPITKRLFSKEFSTYLFDETIEATRGSIQLGTLSGDTLTLNMGALASERIFLDTNNINEVFRVYHVGGNSTSGEDIVVAYSSSTQTY
ncbi:MAG: hypothetical protein V4507_05770, partial [Verrucomicrobiota bacterium]